MPDLRAAMLVGTTEAAGVHQRLHLRERWEQEGGRIDVFGCIDALGADLMFRPLEGLLGAYLPEPAPGIIVSTQRPLSVRRYTAAHELGHFKMKHRASLDDEGLLRRQPFSEQGDYDPQEVAADSFAVSFLLPIWLVAAEMKRHGWTNQSMIEARNVYQLSLRAGLSYEATCYALRRYNIISSANSDELARLKPKVIKQSLVPDFEPQSWYLDVWQLGEKDNGLLVDVARGDVIQIELPERAGSGYLWDIRGFASSDLEIVRDERKRPDGRDRIGGSVIRKLTARAHSIGFGSVRLVERSA